MDFVFISVIFLFFALIAGLAYGCAKLGGAQ